MAKKFYKESELVFAEHPAHKSFINIKFQKFNRLTVIGFAGKGNNINYQWFCRCECGNITKVQASSLKNGRIASCGCKQYNARHGFTRNGKILPTYNSWSAMKDRCSNENHPQYKDWGGRGITVCERWKESFENFLADMGEKPKGTSLDRIKNELGYFKENCRWATRKEQQNNRRDNIFIKYKGRTRTIGQWADEIGINQSTLWSRIVKYGWSIEKSFTTTVQYKR